MKMQKYIWVGLWVLLMAVLAAPAVYASTGDGHLDAGEDVEDELAMAAQNPMADLISVPLQNNFEFGVGPENDMRYILNIQPIIPQPLNENWNLIHRLIVPLIYQPELAPEFGDTFGLSDIQYQGFFGPSDTEGLIWGAGPVLSFPTASDESLGTEKWSAGAGVVALKMSGPWVVGALVNNIWSYAGEEDRGDVNQMLIQYFVNYNFPEFYVSMAPINTANWEADSGQQWTIPLGLGVGKVFMLGKLPMNSQVQAYYNVEHPDAGPDWSMRIQFQFLFPK